MDKERIQIRTRLRLSYNKFRNNVIFFAKLFSLIISLTITLVILDMGFLWRRGGLTANNLCVLLSMFLVFFLRLLLFNGVKKTVLKMYDNKEFNLDDIFLTAEVYSKLTVFLFCFLFSLLIYCVSAGTITALVSGAVYHFLHSLSLSITAACLLGIIFAGAGLYLYMKVYFASYLLIDTDLELIEAVKYSLLLTEGVEKELFMLHLGWQIINFLLFTLWNLLSVEVIYFINSVVGIFLVSTFCILVSVDIYRQLLEDSELDLEINQHPKLSSVMYDFKQHFTQE